jgi:SAM-dependent methyltransferase
VKHTDDARYDTVDKIGELYDAVPLYTARPDIAFYVEEAVKSGGAVLEAGCGTGRVLIPTAREGVDITGIDSSVMMLDRCRARLEYESEETQENVTLHDGDIRDFDLGVTFSLVTIPFRPFQHLLTVDDQMSALQSIHRHLEPGGRLIFDAFHPNLAALAAGARPEAEEMPPTPLPDGRVCSRSGMVRAVRVSEQISDISLVYYVTNPDGSKERVVHDFEMRWFFRYEVEHLLARSGFALRKLYGNFDRSAFADASPEMIFVAERL